MSDEILSAQKKLNDRVLGKPHVTGTAIAEHRGKPCLKVYVSGDADVPKSLDGFTVVVEKSGTFRRL